MTFFLSSDFQVAGIHVETMGRLPAVIGVPRSQQISHFEMQALVAHTGTQANPRHKCCLAPKSSEQYEREYLGYPWDLSTSEIAKLGSCRTSSGDEQSSVEIVKVQVKRKRKCRDDEAQLSMKLLGAASFLDAPLQEQ